MAGYEVPHSPSGLGPGGPPLELRLSCPARPDELRNVRHRFGDFLEDHGLDRTVRDGALLVTAELLTNAFEAGPSDSSIEFAAAMSEAVLAIEVTNRLSPDGIEAIQRLASIGMPDPTAERGRGLPLVAALATRLAVTLEAGAVRIRAELISGR